MKSCANCVCWNRTAYTETGKIHPANMGFCQARAPSVRPGLWGVPDWPITGPGDFCEHDYREGEPKTPKDYMAFKVEMSAKHDWSGRKLATLLFRDEREAKLHGDAGRYERDKGEWVIVNKRCHDIIESEGLYDTRKDNIEPVRGQGWEE